MSHNSQTATRLTAMNIPIVQVSLNTENDPIVIFWQNGDTVASILHRAGISINQGSTAAIGRRRVQDPETTAIQPGETIVIAYLPANG